MDPLDTCPLATPLHLFAAEVGSFFITTAHRRTSYVRTVVVCSLVISSSKSTKTSSPAVGDKMARRSHIFPLSIRSFLFVFVLSHLFSRASACPSRKPASMNFSRHTTRRRANSARTVLCGPHHGKHQAACFSRATFQSCRYSRFLVHAEEGTHLSTGVSRVRSREEFHKVDTDACNRCVDAYSEDICC